MPSQDSYTDDIAEPGFTEDTWSFGTNKSLEAFECWMQLHSRNKFEQKLLELISFFT